MNKNHNNFDIFRTANTALAAYLISKDFGMPEMDESSGTSVYWIFSKTASLDEAVAEFDFMQATGNIVKFFNAYQSLLRRIKER